MWIKTQNGPLVNTDNLIKIEVLDWDDDKNEHEVVARDVNGETQFLATGRVGQVMDRIYYHLSVGDNIMSIPKEGEE